MGERKFDKNSLGHMSKMATKFIYVKNLKNHLLWNQKTDDLAALGTRVLPSSSHNDPGRSNLVPYAFVWEKGITIDFCQKQLYSLI